MPLRAASLRSFASSRTNWHVQAIILRGGLKRCHTFSFLESVHTNIKYWCMMAGMSRTNIEINDQLAREALKLTGLKTKRAVVNGALELLVRTERRKGLLLLRQRRLEG